MERQRISRGLLCHSVDSVRLVLGQRVLAVEILVDNAAHALLAMGACCLTAVVPDRLGILDSEGEHVGCLASCGVEVEAREDGCGSAEGLARLVEGRLSDGVGFGEEVEFD